MECQFCGEEMGIDETGIWLYEHQKGGHMICAIRFQKEKAEDES